MTTMDDTSGTTRGTTMTTDEPTIWDLLDQDAPGGCAAVQDLYSWSLNFDTGKGPFLLFLDLIGWTEEEFGESMYGYADRALGYVELDKLGLALREYAESPQDVREYLTRLMTAEDR